MWPRSAKHRVARSEDGADREREPHGHHDNGQVEHEGQAQQDDGEAGAEAVAARVDQPSVLRRLGWTRIGNSR